MVREISLRSDFDERHLENSSVLVGNHCMVDRFDLPCMVNLPGYGTDEFDIFGNDRTLKINRGFPDFPQSFKIQFNIMETLVRVRYMNFGSLLRFTCCGYGFR